MVSSPLFAQDFVHARQLFSACLELVTEFSPKLRQVMLNEMLLLEVRAHETMAAEGSKERPPPDLVSRVRGYLEMRIHGEIHKFESVVSHSLNRRIAAGFVHSCFCGFCLVQTWMMCLLPCRRAAASGGRGRVCRLHVELEGKRLPDFAGASIPGHEQPLHQGKKKEKKSAV